MKFPRPRVAPYEYTELMVAHFFTRHPDPTSHKPWHPPAAAVTRLRAACDLPRGTLASWPAAGAAFLLACQLWLDGQGPGPSQDEIHAAMRYMTDWPQIVPPARAAWQSRADAGDGIEDAAA